MPEEIQLEVMLFETVVYPRKSTSVYSETSIHRFHRGSEKETMDPGKQ
jgi:hypothetical protein